MRYKLTKETLPRVNELCQLIATTRAVLGGLGSEAQREWDRLRHRFPSNEDLYQGFISLSDLEVEELHTKLRSFCDTVAGAPVAVRPRPTCARPSSSRLVTAERPLQSAAA